MYRFLITQQKYQFSSKDISVCRTPIKNFLDCIITEKKMNIFAINICTENKKLKLFFFNSTRILENFITTICINK